MDKIKIRFEPTNNTLLIWFDNPEKMSHLSPIEDKTPGDFHLIKDENDQVIGIECQFYHIAAGTIALDVENAPLLFQELERA